MERNILILEDNEKCMDAVVDIISGCNNVNVFTSNNISDALLIAYENKIHLFLVDIILNPEIKEDVSGLDFVKALRENKKYEFTPVIFITALEDPKLYSYSQLHCYGYIEKPFDAEQVRKIVGEALEFPFKDDKDDILYFRKDGIVYSVYSKDIVYFVCSSKKLVIKCQQDVLELGPISQKKLFLKLNKEKFISCSRYTIINKTYIEYVDYTNRYVKLRGVEETVEISASSLKRFRENIDD